MNLLFLNINETNELHSFIESWSKLYSFSNELVYKNAISKKELTKTDIQNLYVWKNGMKLSVLKQKSLEDKIKSKLSIINDFKSNDEINLVEFSKEFKNLSAVWKIFLLHLINPNIYPIYDQHIHRTFLFIHEEEYKDLSNKSISNKEKEEFYFKKYLPFIKENSIKDLKKLDEAFFAFGQFLNTRNYRTLFK